MKRYLYIVGLTLSVFSSSVWSASSDFIYPEKFDGQFVKGSYSFFRHGTGKHQGYISVFNFDRKDVESLLPPQLGLAKTDSQKHPVVILWGEMVETGATVGLISWPYWLTYREWQVYIPGVYDKNSSRKVLRTYVPRILVDAFEPEILGRKYFYKKIQLDTMPWDLELGLSLHQYGKMTVAGADEESVGWEEFLDQERPFQAILEWLVKSDIMGEDGEEVPTRCSGFRWRYDDRSQISKADVVMVLEKKFVDGMPSSLLRKPLQSVVSYKVTDWLFDVNYDYNGCP